MLRVAAHTTTNTYLHSKAPSAKARNLRVAASGCREWALAAIRSAPGSVPVPGRSVVCRFSSTLYPLRLMPRLPPLRGSMSVGRVGPSGPPLGSQGNSPTSDTQPGADVTPVWNGLAMTPSNMSKISATMMAPMMPPMPIQVALLCPNSDCHRRHRDHRHSQVRRAK